MKVVTNKYKIKNKKLLTKPTKVKGVWLCVCGGSLRYIPLLKKMECNVCKILYTKDQLN